MYASIRQQLRPILGREVRQELANRHLGGPRKLRRILARAADYGRRRRLTGDIRPEDCLPELEALVRERFAICRLPEALLTPLFVAADARRESATRDRMVVQEGKPFYLDLLNADDYDPASPFMRVALDERLLSTVSSYLGGAAYLQSIELIRSEPVPEGVGLMRSQHWHRDNNNDTRVIKLFVYVTDVADSNGPLTFIPYRLGRKIPWYRGHYVPDEVVGQYVPLERVERFAGPRGSAAMMDTAQVFHFGSRCESPRLTFVAHYNTGFGFFPRTTKHDRWLEHAGELTPLQRLAVGA